MAIKRKIEKNYGKWFLEAGEAEIPGTLYIDYQSYSMELKLYSKINFHGSIIDIKDSTFEDMPSIYGELEGSIYYTLQNCRYAGSSLIGDGLWEITFVPEMSFIGGHLLKGEETKFFEVSCSYPLLSSWYDTNRNYFGSFSDTSDLDNMKPSIESENLIDEIKVDSDLTISIERIYSQNAWLMSKEVSANVKHEVTFRVKSPKTFNEFRKLVYRFLQLIQLATGKLIYLDFNYALANSNDVEKSKNNLGSNDNYIFLPINFFSNIRKRNLTESDYIHQNMMLFYGGENRNKSLNKIIINWFRSYEKYESIYIRYLDTFEWFQNTDVVMSEVMFQNRFLNLVQAIENYHSITYPDFDSEQQKINEAKLEKLLDFIPDIEDKEWLEKKCHLHSPLRKRLHDLIEVRLLFITSEIFKNKVQRRGFIHNIKSIRDKISHGDKVETKEKIGEYYQKALIMLISCILITLGLNEEEIKKTLFRTFNYRNIIEYLKSKIKTQI